MSKPLYMQVADLQRELNRANDRHRNVKGEYVQFREEARVALRAGQTALEEALRQRDLVLDAAWPCADWTHIAQEDSENLARVLNRFGLPVPR